MIRLCERSAVPSLLLALVVVLPSFAAEPPPANELVGTWTLDLSQESEFKGSQDQPNQITLIIEADGWKLTVVNEGGSQEFVGGYVLDAAQTPKLIDVTVRGDAETQELLGIYEINRGKLKFCWRPEGPRPADFTGTAADGVLKIGFVRQKKE
jgi:uncharacterized protein (TIGR03067 family)